MPQYLSWCHNTYQTFQSRGSSRETGEGSPEAKAVSVRTLRQTDGVQVQAQGARGADAREKVPGRQVHRVRPRVRPQEADGPPQEPGPLPRQVRNGWEGIFTTFG